MNKFKAIGFDYGGVLNDSKSTLPGISKILNVPQDELRAIYFKNNHLANVDGLSYEELWKKIAVDLGQPEKATDISEHMHQQWSYETNKDMLALVEELRTRGIKVGLLSNNTKEIGDKLRAEGVDKYFDCFIISAETGFQKPDPRIFSLLLEQLDVKAEELIFTDDSTNSLRTAEEVGYHPILFTGYVSFRQELVKLGVLPS